MEGFVERFMNGIAYLTIGEFEAELPVEELTSKGIKELRRFKCEIVDGYIVNLEAIPDKVLTEEDYKRIYTEINEKLSDGPQDDY